MIALRQVKVVVLSAVCALAAAVSTRTQAQETESSSQGRVSYGPDYFAAYNVSNAEDMIRLVPGGSSILEATNSTQQQRGFGSGGTQILINGRRFPGKANEIATSLRRLAPASVENIELISGTAEGITTQSSGNLLNIVLRPGATVANAGTWELAGRFNDQGRSGVDGLLSYRASRSGWTYELGAERNVWSPPALGPARWSDRTRAEAWFYPSGVLQEDRPQRWAREHEKWIYTGALSYDFVGGARLDFNGFHEQLEVVETDSTNFTRFSQAGVQTLTGAELHLKDSRTRKTTEFSGEYQGDLGAGALHALAIYRRVSTPALEFRNQTRNNALFEISRSATRVGQAEDIGRLSWTRPLGVRRSLELGGEVARNVLEQNLQVFFDLNQDGRVEAVAIPTAQAQVKELRGDLFATLRITPFDRWSIESGVTWEQSQITNNYPFNPGNRLAYLRPRLDVRRSVRQSDQLRLTIERKVSQLDFNNFVPKVNVVDSRIDAGNPALRPEVSWSYELSYQRRLAQDAGLLELRFYYDDISGKIEKVPLSDAFGLFSASGNVPTARRSGVELNASVRLGAIRLRNALLSYRYQHQSSALRDPFTAMRRRIQGDRGDNNELEFRHELVALGASYGFSRTDDGGLFFANRDLPVTSWLDIKTVHEAFIEKKLGGAFVLRIEGQNIGGARELQWRDVYLLNAIDGRVARRDYYDERRDTRVAVRLRGRF